MSIHLSSNTIVLDRHSREVILYTDEYLSWSIGVYLKNILDNFFYYKFSNFTFY